MADPADKTSGDFKMDQTNLYREEIFTDLKVGSIRRLTPVKQDASLDKTRDVLFVGQTHLMTQAGPLPVQAPINAKNLQEAMERFPAAVNRAVDQLVAEAEEVRRREASRIVVPGSGTSKLVVP
jgi:hypothetical protein